MPKNNNEACLHAMRVEWLTDELERQGVVTIPRKADALCEAVREAHPDVLFGNVDHTELLVAVLPWYVEKGRANYAASEPMPTYAEAVERCRSLLECNKVDFENMSAACSADLFVIAKQHVEAENLLNKFQMFGNVGDGHLRDDIGMPRELFDGSLKLQSVPPKVLALYRMFGEEYPGSRFWTHPVMPNEPKVVNGHPVYTDLDEDRPNAVCDENRQTVLNMCKVCGRAEIELDEPCTPKEAT